jgi:hypothetical protein
MDWWSNGSMEFWIVRVPDCWNIESRSNSINPAIQNPLLQQKGLGLISKP